MLFLDEESSDLVIKGTKLNNKSITKSKCTTTTTTTDTTANDIKSKKQV